MGKPRTSPRRLAGTRTRELYRELEDVFLQVLDAETGEREARLAELCAGRDDVRHEVESLLGYADQTLPERFAHCWPLGEGGFGVVFSASDRKWGSVAVKRLIRQDAGSVLRFKAEFRNRDFIHPNLLRIHELLEDDSGILFLVMERLEGEDLANRLARHPADLTVPEVDATLRQLAVALCALHDRGIIHRDVKPENVWLKPDGTVVLIDFGLAVREASVIDNLTEGVLGTKEYVAPERIHEQIESSAADWFSLGILLREMIAALRDGTASAALIALSDLLSDPDLGRRAGAQAVYSYLNRVTEAPLAAAERPPVPRLVGRDREFRLLQQCFDRSRTRPVCVFLSGASGEGKTELAEAFLNAVSPSALILSGRCHEAENVPFRACDAVVDRLCEYLLSVPEDRRNGLLGEDLNALAVVFPVFRQFCHGNSARVAEGNADLIRTRAFGSLRAILCKVGAERPVVIFVDDLHWGDLPSGGFFETVLGPGNSPAILAILAWRTQRPDSPKRGGKESDEPLPDWLCRRRHTLARDVLRIRLRPLEPRFSRQLVRAIFAGSLDDPQGALTASIAGLARGNPFLLHEVAEYCASGHAPPDSTDAMEVLAFSIARRVASLTPEAQKLLEVLAVSDVSLRDKVARKVSDTRERYERAREELIAAHLARSAASRNSRTLDVYHSRQRSGIQNTLHARVPSIHAQLAGVYGRKAPLLAYHHLKKSGNIDRCPEFAILAGDRATRQLAFEQAAKFYGEAVEWRTGQLQRPGQDEQLFEAHRKRAEAMAALGRGRDASDAYRRAEESLGVEQPFEALRMRVRATGQLLFSGNLRDGLDQFRGVCRDSKIAYPRRSPGILGLILWLQLRLWLRGFELRKSEFTPPLRGVQLEVCWTGLIGTSLLETTRSAYYAVRHVLWALDSGDPGVACRSLAVLGAITSSFSPWSGKAAKMVEAACTINGDMPGTPDDAFIKSMTAIVAVNLGHWAQALQSSSEALLFYRRTGTGGGWVRSTTATYWLSARIVTGDWTGVQRELPFLRKDARERGDRLAAVNLVLLSNYLLAELASGHSREARSTAVELYEEWTSQTSSLNRKGPDLQKFCVDMTLVECDLFDSKPESAWKRLLLVRSEVASSDLKYVEVLRVRFEYAFACAAISLSAAAPENEYLGAAKKSSRWLLRASQSHAAALGYLTSAGIASIAGRRPDVPLLLKKGLAAANRIGMRPVAAMCGERLAGFGVVSSATEWFYEQNIRDRDYLLNALAPGRWSRN